MGRPGCGGGGPRALGLAGAQDRGSVGVLGAQAPAGHDDAATNLTYALRHAVEMAGFRSVENVPSLEQAILVLNCAAPDEGCLGRVATERHLDRVIIAIMSPSAPAPNAPLRVELRVYVHATRRFERTIVITLPLFPVVNALKLNDTHAILILLYAAFFVSLSTWIVKAGIDQLPRELEEAARVDGATLPQLLRLVVLPLIAPTLVAASVFVLVFAWNEFLFAFIFTTTKAKTAPLILSEMMGAAM